MNIIIGSVALELREKYINKFINTCSEHYIKYVRDKKTFVDGLCYTGYLWDCYENFYVCTEVFCEQFLKDKQDIFIMWDIHSSERILIPDYWKYPRESVLCIESWNKNKYMRDLPEDIYLFDATFSWSIAYTHEEDDSGMRFVYFALPASGSEGQGAVKKTG